MSDETVLTPITPADGENLPPKVSPFGAAPAASTPAPAAPAPVPAAESPAPSPTAAVSTIRLKPIIRKPVIRKPVAGVAPKPAAPAASKKATQNLKSVTGPIPVQATLRKTGIISEGILTPAQAQAAKSKTSRISLESAIGAAPAKESPMPLKTIRLRRPADLKPSPLTPVTSTSAAAPAAVTPPPPAPAEPEASAEDAGVTQKKTLKLHRPGSVMLKRPSLNLGTPAADASSAEGDASAVADIGEIKDLNPAPLSVLSAGAPAASSHVAGVPKIVAVFSLLTGVAAILALAVALYFLYLEGCSPVAGANEMAFIQM